MTKKLLSLFSVLCLATLFFSARTHMSFAVDQPSTQTTRRILMFVAYNDVWWAEYKVVYEALIAQGYEVDVRSSATGEAHTYGHNVLTSANQISSYADFTDQFMANFGTAWSAGWNAPATIPLNLYFAPFQLNRESKKVLKLPINLVYQREKQTLIR